MLQQNLEAALTHLTKDIYFGVLLTSQSEGHSKQLPILPVLTVQVSSTEQQIASCSARLHQCNFQARWAKRKSKRPNGSKLKTAYSIPGKDPTKAKAWRAKCRGGRTLSSAGPDQLTIKESSI